MFMAVIYFHLNRQKLSKLWLLKKSVAWILFQYLERFCVSTLYVLSIYNSGYIEKKITDPYLSFVYLHGSMVQYHQTSFKNLRHFWLKIVFIMLLMVLTGTSYVNSGKLYW